jgi:hypothetical protein
MKSYLIGLNFLLFFLISISGQGIAQEISISNITSEAIITKSTPQVPTILSGEPFSYKINFQNLNQSNLLSITDVLPSGLCYTASDIVADPSFIDFAGNVVPNPNSIPGLIDTSGLPTVNFVIPNYIQRGSFTITVSFCAGVTPDGFTVINNICATYGPGGGSDENFCSTTGLTSTAEAINPWGEISKEPLFPAILGAGGDYYIPTTAGSSNYKIRIEKDPLYAGSMFGMLNLTNATISEMFLPCATVSLISGPGTLNTSTNTITLTTDLYGNVPFEYAEFIVNVDYSGCGTFANNQVINNTVELNGTPIGENPIININSGSADVIAVDNLPPPNLSSSIIKNVEVSNPVPGCLGEYRIFFTNTDNRPISLIDISDVLPNDVIPQNLSIYGTINSASSTNSFDLIINNGVATTLLLNTGYNGNPWNTNNNSFDLIANATTELYPGDYIEIVIPFIINNSIPIGTDINNCTDMTGSIIDPPNNINVSLNSNSCVTFTIENPEIKLCATKGVRKANTTTPFLATLTNIIPTDELEFQICMQNNGSLDFNGQLEDVLDFKYEFISVVSSNFPTGTTFNQNGQTLTWSNIDLLQSCNTFSGIYGCINPSNQSYCAVIKVKVKALTIPGNIDNIATLSGSNTSPFTTVPAKVNVITSSVLKLEQDISVDNVSYSGTIQLNPICDDLVYHRIKITNLGNTPVSQYQIINEFPQVNDVYYPTTLNRNSTFSYTTLEDNSSPNYTVSYLNVVPSLGISPSNFDCNTAPSGSPTPTNNDITLVYNSLSALAPGASNTIIVEAKILDPYILSSNDNAVNSAYFVDCGSSNGNIIVPSNQVVVDIETPLDICYELDLEPYANAVPTIFPTTVKTEIATSSPTKDKEYGDFDNDGDIDILYTKIDTNNNIYLYVLINNAGVGNPPAYSIPGVNLTFLGISSVEYSIRFVDWDLDGWNDIIVHGPNNGTYLYINDQNGSVNNGLMMLNGGYDYPSIPFSSPQLIAVGDLNNDSLPDLLISGQGNEIYGTAYFENNGSNTYPYFTLASPQSYTGGLIHNIFIPENNGSYPTPEIYDADCDGDNDIFISDPLLGSPNWEGGRMYFYENQGGVTSGMLPDINITPQDNQFGFVDIPGSDMSCDWVITRLVDYFNNGCPIAISYNPCSDEFYYYDRICYTCPSEVLAIEDEQDNFENNNIFIYPNPTKTAFNIGFNNNVTIDEITIYSIHGIEIKHIIYDGSQIDIKEFPTGIYFVKITSEGKSITKKIIKN